MNELPATEGPDSLAETSAFLREVELDSCQVTTFTPFPGTPAYPTIRQHGTFEEDWEYMNAMNFVFIPNGLSETARERHCSRAFYSRPDILWNLTRLIMREPRVAARLASSAYTYVGTKFRQGRYVVGRIARRASAPAS